MSQDIVSWGESHYSHGLQAGLTQMEISKNQVGISILFLCFSWAGAANATTMLSGTAVGFAGSETSVGLIGRTPADSSPTLGAGQFGLYDAIKYFIPLDEDYNGVYGVDGSHPCGSAGAGTCSDIGSGSGYSDASALQMNIWFDTNSVQAQSASLAFIFDDLDLIGDSDPVGFFESISLSYWKWNGTDFGTDPLAMSGTIIKANESGGPKTFVSNLVTWDLGISDLMALNLSSQDNGGFWIQLGFGSDYYRDGKNTAEFLAAGLNISAVPVPAAFWLFGTALIGFIGMSRRTRV
jgi:hypothetical protein